MINTVSLRMAARIKEANPGHPASIDVLRYAIASLFNIFGTILVASVLGLVLGHLSAVALALTFFALLRMISGGRHLKSGIGCIAATSLAANVIPYISLSNPVNLSLTITSMVLAYFFAPNNLERTSRIPTRYYPMLKYVAILLIGINLLLHLDVLAIAFLIQCLSLIRVGGDPK